MRRCARMAAASTGRRISAATPAIAWCSRRSAKILPRNAVWYASNLKRTHQTAEAIWAAGFPKPSDMPHVNAFAEQHLGEWQGMNRAAFLREPAGRQPLAYRRSTNPRPAARVSWTSITASAAPSSASTPSRRAGTSSPSRMAARSGPPSALALGGQPEKGLAFDIDNCSVTRLDHLASANYAGWRLPMVNQQPWIADASHNAMHQPAGPGGRRRRRRNSLDALELSKAAKAA